MGDDTIPTDTADPSENWTVQTKFKGPTPRMRATFEHKERGSSMVIEEMPTGAARISLRVPANLPGGYDEVHTTSIQSYDDPARNWIGALKEVGRLAAMYDTEGTWIIEGAPVLH